MDIWSTGEMPDPERMAGNDMNLEQAEIKEALFVKNCVFLAKRGRCLGVLERKAGMQTGRLSRKPVVSLAEAVVFASELGMSIDDLCSRDIESEMKIQELKEEINRLEIQKRTAEALLSSMEKNGVIG